MVSLLNKQEKRSVLIYRIFTLGLLFILLVSVTACEDNDENPNDLSLLDLFISVVNNLRFTFANRDDIDNDPFYPPDPGESGSVESAQSEGYLEDDTMPVSPADQGVPSTGPETSADELPKKPVGFVNYGTFDAMVRAVPYTPLGALGPQIPPPPASTVSTAKPPSGIWPNTSRFITVPLGSYTWCIDWEEGDIDEDGYFDYYHYFQEGQTILDENDSDDLDFAEEVAISAPPNNVPIYKGKCGEPNVDASCYGKTTTIQSYVLYMKDHSNPPDEIMPGSAETSLQNVKITFSSGTTTWGGSRILWVAGDWVEVSTSNSYAAMGVQVQGDRTIGWARVLFDGKEVWQGNTATTWNDGTNNGVYVEVKCFPPGFHTLRIEALGIDGGGGGITVPVSYFGF
jgi:hypothetical protein